VVAVSAGQAQAAPHPARAAGRSQVAAGVISTVAGSVGGPAKATDVGLYAPCGVTFSAGSVYAADSPALRKINPRTDWLTTPAGNGIAGPAFDGPRATRASIDACTVAFDRNGNAALPNPSGNGVQVVAARTGTFYGQAMTAGHIYTVAGNGSPGFSGDGGPATKAELSFPTGVGVDSAGNLVIADSQNERVRVVAAATGRFYGQAMTAGDIYTVAGDGTPWHTGDGGPAVKAGIRLPGGVAFDHSGNLVIAGGYGDNRIRLVAAATGTFYGQAMTAGDIYTVAGGGTGGLGNGIPATDAQLADPGAVAVDRAGNLLISDTISDRIRVVAAATGTFYGQAMTAGDIYTVAGGGKGRVEDGGPAAGARLVKPMGVAVGAAGSIVIADTGNGLIRIVTG
jgi:NHL repeat